MNKQYDVIVIGAGMVGLTVANCLANTELEILVLDHHPLLSGWQLPEVAGRVSAINCRSQDIFIECGAWQRMTALRVSPYQHMHVWDSEGTGVIDFDSAQMDQAELGHIIENDVLTTALQQNLKDCKHVTLLAPVQLQEMRRHGVGMELITSAGSFHAPLLIGADGAHSWLRQQCHIELTQQSYEHKAIVATVTTEKPHQQTAWQRFLPTGPLAFLPLSDPHQCSIVWSSVPQKADFLMEQEDESFKTLLATAFDHQLGKMVAVGPRACYPLHMRHAKDYTQEGIALIGDAAHTIHPLAGQGVNLGIADAHELATVIRDALARRQRYGKHAILRRYERARKAETSAMILTMAGFKELFASENTWVTRLRNQGLSLVNRCTPVKSLIMRQAMGKLMK
jgi:2-octaprenylphenol hydroxylase